jgi:hypothetical protein
LKEPVLGFIIGQKGLMYNLTLRIPLMIATYSDNVLPLKTVIPATPSKSER